MDNQSLLYVGGNKTAFRCECGCNVFHRVTDSERPGKVIYKCNACGMWYSVPDEDEQGKIGE